MLSFKQSISQLIAKVGKNDFIIQPVRSFSISSALCRRINTRRPRPPGFDRALLDEICKVKYPPNLESYLPTNQRCEIRKAKQMILESKGLDKENPYQNILAREVREHFDNNKMIAIVHRHSMLAETLFEVKVIFKTAGMKIREDYGRSTIEKGLANSKYISIMPLFKISEALILSPDANVAALLKTLKKTPQLTLLAVIVDGQLLSKAQAEFYASTDLVNQQAGLVQTINSVATTLTSHLNHHASTLVTKLDQYAAGESRSESESSKAVTDGDSSATGTDSSNVDKSS